MKQRVADQFEDFVNKRNASVIHKNMTTDFYDNDGPGGRPTGVEGDEQMMLKMYGLMPDLQLTIAEMIAKATGWFAGTYGAGPTLLRRKGRKFTASCFGDLKAKDR